jgi:hypothetical protein
MKYDDIRKFLIGYIIACDDVYATIPWYDFLSRLAVARKRWAAMVLYESVSFMGKDK